jgi:drug/metabolite transporter (DMT)-like permease
VKPSGVVARLVRSRLRRQRTPGGVRRDRRLSWSGILAVGYVAYVSTLLGFGIWNRLIAEYSVSRVAPFSLLVPVFGLAAS